MPELEAEELLAVIAAACEAGSARPRVSPVVASSGWWISVAGEYRQLPDQGWKLHVSAGIATAEAVLRRVLPVLLDEGADFKVMASLRRLDLVNGGYAGLAQVGKFITVYPYDDARAVRLAAALEAATRGLRGPRIRSDRPLAPGSLVHYRYGAFANRYVQIPGGEPILAIVAPGGELVPDPRNTGYQPPAWAVDPFLAAGVALTLPEPGLLLGGCYLITEALHHSARGAVARAVDVRTLRRCVIKRAARDAVMQPDGRDAHDLLRDEAAVLQRLAPDARFPRPYELWAEDGDLFLALEELLGPTLEHYVAELAGRGCGVEPAEIMHWGRDLADVLAALHEHGFVYRDMKPSNVIRTESGALRLVDFDSSHELGASSPPWGTGTPPFASPQQYLGAPPSVADDIYGLGALLWWAANGGLPTGVARPAAGTAPGQPASGGWDVIAYGRLPLHLLPPSIGPTLRGVIERCLEPDPTSRFGSMAELGAALAAGK